jgi:hypothetical protein
MLMECVYNKFRLVDGSSGSSSMTNHESRSPGRVMRTAQAVEKVKKQVFKPYDLHDTLEDKAALVEIWAFPPVVRSSH